MMKIYWENMLQEQKLCYNVTMEIYIDITEIIMKISL